MDYNSPQKTYPQKEALVFEKLHSSYSDLESTGPDRLMAETSKIQIRSDQMAISCASSQ